MFDSCLQSRSADSFPPNSMVTSWTTHGDQVCRKFTVHVNPFGSTESACTLLPAISALLAYPAGHVTCWSSASRAASKAELMINDRSQLSGNFESRLLLKSAPFDQGRSRLVLVTPTKNTIIHLCSRGRHETIKKNWRNKELISAPIMQPQIPSDQQMLSNLSHFWFTLVISFLSFFFF